jgi:hypothetical protein
VFVTATAITTTTVTTSTYLALAFLLYCALHKGLVPENGKEGEVREEVKRVGRERREEKRKGERG